MSNLINPGFWLVALLLALGLFGAGYTAGHKAADNACAAAQIKVQQAAQVVADQENARREHVAAARETSREQIRIVYRTLKEQAHALKPQATPPQPPLYKGEGGQTDGVGCGLDADGLRLWNAANGGAAAPLRRRLDGDLPGTPPGALGQAGGPAGQPYRGDGAVQPVPRPDEPTAGMPGREVVPRAALMGAV